MNEGAYCSGPPHHVQTYLFHCFEAGHIANKQKQTPFYNPFNLEQSRRGLGVKEGEWSMIKASLDGVPLFFWFCSPASSPSSHFGHSDYNLPQTSRGEA